MTKVTLPRLFRAKWLKALRSGRFKQARSALYRDGGYCCLGVAARVCDVPNTAMIGPGSVQGLITDNAIKANSILGRALTEKAGAQRAWFVGQLMTMNDAGTQFPAIADYIEANTRAV